MFWYNKLIQLSTSAVSSTSDMKVGCNLKATFNFYYFPKYIMGYSIMLKEFVLTIQGKLDLIRKKDCLFGTTN